MAIPIFFRTFASTKRNKIMRRIKRKAKIYSVDWLRNGLCYRTTMGCTWEDVLECKRTAKLLGETIKYEHYNTTTVATYTL